MGSQSLNINFFFFLLIRGIARGGGVLVWNIISMWTDNVVRERKGIYDKSKRIAMRVLFFGTSR
jgi:hypothetical protein